MLEQHACCHETAPSCGAVSSLLYALEAPQLSLPRSVSIFAELSCIYSKSHKGVPTRTFPFFLDLSHGD